MRQLVVRSEPLTVERTVVEQSLRVGFGVAALVTEAVLQALVPKSGRGVGASAPAVVDAALGVSWGAARAGGRLAGLSMTLATPVVRVALDPPLVPHQLRPLAALDTLTGRWRDDRAELAREAVLTSKQIVPAVVDSVATTVDLDLLVATVVDRLDLDALVLHVLRRIDLDEVAGQAVSELDLTPILSEAVQRVDLQPIVTEVIDELDLAAVVSQVLREVDLTAIVTEQVDLGEVVNSALDDLDLTALVMQRVDLVTVADYVVDAIDLPGIVRDSTGSIASETVRAVRFQAVDGDRALSRMVDRFTLRGGRARKLDAPGNPESAAPEEPGVERMSDDAASPAPISPTRRRRTPGLPPEAVAFQGDRAGIVSRVIANTIDFAVIVAVLVGMYVGWAAFLFLLSPTTFTFPSPSLGSALLVGGALLTFYFWVSWATTGRTYGDIVMGLRVVNFAGERMHWAGAFVRAVFCVVFPIGLFWVAVSGANRSVQDVVLRTSVIYDWRARPVPGSKIGGSPRP